MAIGINLIKSFAHTPGASGLISMYFCVTFDKQSLLFPYYAHKFSWIFQCPRKYYKLVLASSWHCCINIDCLWSNVISSNEFKSMHITSQAIRRMVHIIPYFPHIDITWYIWSYLVIFILVILNFPSNFRPFIWWLLEVHRCKSEIINSVCDKIQNSWLIYNIDI